MATQVTCSFCGRNKKDVDLMISGIHAHICDKCISQAQQILNEELKTKSTSESPSFNLVKPVDMMRHLDEFVIGQEEAKKFISVAVYNHYKRLMQQKDKDDVVIEKSTSLWLVRPERVKHTSPGPWLRFCKSPFVLLMQLS